MSTLSSTDTYLCFGCEKTMCIERSPFVTKCKVRIPPIPKASLIKPDDEVDRKNDEIEFVKVEREEAEAEERGRVTEKKIISTALHGYGADKQRVKCIEELAELQKEICKDLIGGGSQFHIAEEIADVEIVIAQMKIYYGCARDVAAIKAQKLKQLAKNLGMESDED